MTETNKLSDSFSKNVTEVISRDDKDGSWKAIIKLFNDEKRQMVPIARVKVSSISNLMGEMKNE